MWAPWLGNWSHMLGEKAAQIKKGTPSKMWLEIPLGKGDAC